MLSYELVFSTLSLYSTKTKSASPDNEIFLSRSVIFRAPARITAWRTGTKPHDRRRTTTTTLRGAAAGPPRDRLQGGWQLQPQRCRPGRSGPGDMHAAMARLPAL